MIDLENYMRARVEAEAQAEYLAREVLPLIEALEAVRPEVEQMAHQALAAVDSVRSDREWVQEVRP